jgi:hemolysin D
MREYFPTKQSLLSVYDETVLALPVKPKINQHKQQTTRRNRSNTFDRQALLKSSPLWSRGIIWSIIFCTAGTIIWACLAQIDEAIPSSGQLEPQEAIKDIQSPVTGVVNTIYVKDGQKVEKGDLLLKLDPQGQASELSSLVRIRKTLQAENEFYKLQLELPRDRAYESQILTNIPHEMLLLAGNRQSFVSENQMLYVQLQSGNGLAILTPEQQLRMKVRLREESTRANISQFDYDQLQEQYKQSSVELVSAQKTLHTNQGLLQDIIPLVESGGIARIEQIKQAEAVQKAEAEVLRLQREQAKIKLSIAQANQKYVNTVSVSQKDLLDNIAVNDKQISEIDSQFAKATLENERKIAEIDNRLAQTKLMMKYQEIHAPGEGVIFEMKVKAPGFVVNASEPILKLVPSESLTGKVYVTNKDIGFIRTGMLADIRIDSFPFSEYGDIKGKITWIGSDSLPPTDSRPYYSFPVKVELNSQSIKTIGKPLELQSGMSISVNIKTRKRSILSLFTEEFTTQVDQIRYLR